MAQTGVVPLVPLQRGSPDFARREAVGTGTSQDLVVSYLREIGQFPLLSAAEEVSLAKSVEVGLLAEEQLSEMNIESEDELGDKPSRAELAELVRIGQAAKHRLVESNLRLVVSVARRYTRRGLNLLDLIQEGNVGLIRAVERFDFAKGFKFSTYASWWIRQAISRALADQGRTIRLPVHVSDQLNRLLRAMRRLSQAIARDPTVTELADATALPPERVLQLLAYADEPVSLQSPVGEKQSDLGEFVEDSDAMSPADIVARAMLREHINRILASLSEREQAVVRLRYGLEDGRARTLEEVGEVFGVTRERVRQIESRTLNKLRTGGWTAELREYLR